MTEATLLSAQMCPDCFGNLAPLIGYLVYSIFKLKTRGEKGETYVL
jgi:hypothetical protein